MLWLITYRNYLETELKKKIPVTLKCIPSTSATSTVDLNSADHKVKALKGHAQAQD